MKILALLVLLIVSISFFPCFAQPVLVGELTHGPVSGYIFDLTLTIHNVGTEPFNCTFSSSEQWFYSIDGVMVHSACFPVVIPYTLSEGQSDTFSLTNYQIINSGNHTLQAYLAINEGSPIGDPITIEIAPEIAVNIGEGSQLSRIPIDFFWRSTLYECIFTADELQHQSGALTAISFFPDFHTLDMLGQQITIYITHTHLNDLEDDWIPATGMLSVFNGLADFPINHDEVRINLTSSFCYNGIDNLAMMVFRPIPSSYAFHGDSFHAYSADPLRSRKAYTDNLTFNPRNPPDPTAAQHIEFMPQTALHMIPIGPSGVFDEHLVPVIADLKVSPNPVAGRCKITTDLKATGEGRVSIYNLKGQMVKSLPIPSTGSAEVEWDGCNNLGDRCASGIYLLHYQDTKNHATGKLLLLR